MSGFTAPALSDAGAAIGEAVPEQIFDILTSRDFCYLSKARVGTYRESILALFAASARRREPLRFYYDIGGGYHASVRPGVESVSFEVGLAELFVLRQAAELAARLGRLYPLGVRFTLVIDNLCALLVNDIPTSRTLEYCAALRELVRNVGLDGLVDVLVESEHFSIGDFERARSTTRSSSIALTQKQHENVARFLGRPCEKREALDRAQRYAEVVAASEKLLAPLIMGVHMTQRATRDTICFRPFPGGDSRIQCGEVAMTRNNKQKLCPMLLTSGNVGDHVYRRYRLPGLLPALIPHVTYAERLSA